MLEVVSLPQKSSPDAPPDPGLFAVKGLFVRHGDKPMVIEALDNARVDAWRASNKWDQRVASAAQALAGSIKISEILGISKGWRGDPKSAWEQAKAEFFNASWHHSLFKAAQEGIEQYDFDPSVIVQYTTHVNPVLSGIRRGIRIINAEREAAARARGEAPPPPKYVFEYEDVTGIRYDYTSQHIIPIDLSGISAGPGIPPPRVPYFNPGSPHQPLKVRDAGPFFDWINPRKNPSPPNVPLAEPDKVRDTFVEKLQKQDGEDQAAFEKRVQQMHDRREAEKRRTAQPPQPSGGIHTTGVRPVVRGHGGGQYIEPPRVRNKRWWER
jgi:hypothetical protein